MFRARLTISRDVYRKHPDALTEEEERYLGDMVALAALESEEINERRK